MASNAIIGRYIRERRKILGITQVELAGRLKQRGFDYSVQTIGHWEAGRVAVPLAMSQGENVFLESFASSLEVSPLRILEVLGYLDGIDLKFDVETYEIAQLAEHVSPVKRKIIKDLLKEMVSDQKHVQQS